MSILKNADAQFFCGAGACLFRSHQNRLKGRDWFHFLWYVSREVHLSLPHLQARAAQLKELNCRIASPDDAKDLLQLKVDSFDLRQAKDDVLPFVRDRGIVDGWTKELFHTAIERL